MELLNLFKQHLQSSKSNSSKSTIKNYVSDIRHFLGWIERLRKKTVDLEEVTPDVIKLYEKTLGGTIVNGVIEPGSQLSVSSMKRHLSSLRKLFTFLESQKINISNPFREIAPEISEIPTDYWHVKSFKDYLLEKRASKITVKNYVSDIQGFAKWYEEAVLPGAVKPLTSAGGLYLITQSVLEDYRNRLLTIQNAAPRTVNRKLSSLRRYIEFARAKRFIKDMELTLDPVAVYEQKVTSQNTPTIALEELSVSVSNELKHSKFPPFRLAQKLFVFPYLQIEEKAANVIAGIITGKPVSGVYNLPKKIALQLAEKNTLRASNQLSNAILSGSNIAKEFYAPEKISLLGLPLHKKAIHHMRYTRPSWYRKYHDYQFVHYAHFALLVIFAAGVGVALYNNLVAKQQKSSFAAAVAPPRILSFQGRLTDNLDNPITSSTNIRFAIYNDSSASGSALLWQEVIGSIAPDQDGIFSVILGEGTVIPSTVFSDNANVYLGVTIFQTPELTPRQRIASVGYATNAEFLQGLPPTTQAGITSFANVILALDSSGNLTLSDTSPTNHTFQVTNGAFRLSGQSLQLLTNSGSDGNVILNPDGFGQIDIRKGIINDTNNGSILPGGVEVHDRFGVLATESAVAAFIVNNNTTGGDILAASSSGTTRFVIQNDGSIITPFYNGQNAVLYGLQTSGLISQAVTATSGLCLQSGASSPSWGNCGGDSYWTLSSGALSPIHNSVDLLVGGNTTASAKFRFINNLTGTPVASISANSGNNATFLSGDGTLGTTNRQTLTIGNSSTYNTTGNILINPNGVGRIGIGTTQPLTTFDLRGNSGTLPAASISAQTSFAALLVNNSGSGDLITASQGGLPVFRVKSNGDVVLGSEGEGKITVGIIDPYLIQNQKTSGIQSLTFQTLGATNADFIFQNTSTELGRLTMAGQLRLPITGSTGGIVIGGDTQIFRGAADRLDVASGDSFNIVNGSLLTGGVTRIDSSGNGTFNTLTVSSCSGCLSASNSPFEILNGAIVPLITTPDFLLGGTTTASAKFAVLNMNGGTPTASISANSGNIATYIKGDGTIGTTNRQTLTIGNSSTYNTTGSVLINPNGTGNVGIGTTNATEKLDVNGNIRISDDANGALILGRGDNVFEGGQINFLAAGSYDGWILDSYQNTLRHYTNSANSNQVQILNVGSGTAGLYIEGSTGIGTETPTSQLYVTRPLSLGVTGKALAIFDQIEAQDILAASASGTTRFVINNNGNLQAGFGQTNLSTITKTGSTSRTFTLPDEAGTFCLQGSGSCGFSVGTNWWTTSTDGKAITPINSTQDLLIGGNATSSAKFAVLNLAGGTPVATVAGNFIVQANNGNGGFVGIGTNNPSAPLHVARIQSADPIAQFSSAQAASIYLSGGSGSQKLWVSDGTDNFLTGTTAGDSGIYFNLGTDYFIGEDTQGPRLMIQGTSGNIGIGTISPASHVSITRALSRPVTGKALVSLDQLENQDIFAASASGTPRFVINNNGNLQAGFGQTNLSTITKTGSTSRTFTLPDEAGTFCLQGSSSCGFSVGTNWWTTSTDGKALTPINSTQDFLLGGNATTSAKFAVLNLAGGTPTASVSSGLNGTGIYLAADGNIQTTNNQPLAIGGNTSGNLVLKSENTNVFKTFQTTNIGVGQNAGAALIGGATNNSLFGSGAGQSITTADNNTILGYQAGNLSTNSTNTFVGSFAGYNNSNGANVFIGVDSGYGGAGNTSAANVAIGNETLAVHTDASYNVVVGDNAGNDITTGDQNIILGAFGGDGLTAGGDNIMLGYFTQVETNSLSNSIALGSRSRITASNQLVVGDDTGGFNISDSYWGEGVVSASPSDFTFNATGGSGTDITGANLYLAGGKGTGNAAGGSVILSTSLSGASGTTLQSSTERMRIDGNGRLGLGTSSPISELHVTRPLTFGATGKALVIFDQIENQDIFTASSSGTTRFTIGYNGNIAATGTLTGLTGLTLASGAITLGGSTGTGLCLLGGATASWGSCSTGSTAGTWVLDTTNKVHYPINNTVDLIVGGTSTASAKFAVLNLAGGTPTASISANSGNIATYIKGDGTIATTNRQTLTIGNSTTYDTTGNVLINPNGTGNVGIGTSSPAYALHLTKTSAGSETQPLFIHNNSSTNGSASSLTFGAVSGTTITGKIMNTRVAGSNYALSFHNFGASGLFEAARFDLVGNFGIGTNSPISALHITRPTSMPFTGKSLAIFDQIESQDILTASAGGTTRFVINNNGNLQAGFGQTNLSTITKTGSTARTYTLPDEAGTICLQGSTSCGFGSGTNYWQINSNLISPINSTFDFAVGGSATTSAKFAVLNLAGGTPTASISANSGNNATLLTGGGNLATTNMQNLTLGGSTTGDINFVPNTTVEINKDLNRTSLTGTSKGLFHLNGGPDFGSNEITALTLGESSSQPDKPLTIIGAQNTTNGSNLFFGTSNNYGSGITNTSLFIDYSGKIGLGTTSPTSELYVTRPLSMGVTGKAVAIFDQIENQDILTASAGGTTRFTIANNGTLTASAYTTNGGLFYANASGVLAQTGAGTGIQCLLGGTTPTWGSCTGSGFASPFQVNSGSIIPLNSSLDTLLGGQASTSAVFKVTGQGNPFAGTQVGASVSASTSFAGLAVDNKGVGDLITASSSGVTQFVVTNNGALGLGLLNGQRPTAKLDVNGLASISGQLSFRNGTGTIQTTQNNTLTIGGTTTGSISLDSGNGTINLLDNTYINGTLTGLTGLTLASGGITLGGTTGTSNLCLLGGATAAWGACVSSTNAPFQVTQGAINPLNSTLDTLLGGQASTSAAFKVTGQGNPFRGTQVGASVSANTSFAGLVVDNKGVGDIFTASSSGVTQLVVTNNGALGLGILNGQRPTAKLDVNGLASISGQLSFRNGTGTIQTTQNNTLTIGGTTTGSISLDSGNGTINLLDNTYLNGTLTGLTGLTLASGPITLGGSTGSGQCLLGGATASWGSCTGGTPNYFQLNSNLVSPINSTFDFAVGGTATTSAKFAVLNVAGGTPTASISANSGNNATYVTGNGTLATTNRQTLTIGNSSTFNTTGNILLHPNGTGRVGLGTTTPSTALDIRGGALCLSEGNACTTTAAGDLTWDNSSGGNGFQMDYFSGQLYMGDAGGAGWNFVVDESTDVVGVNTSAPGRALEINSASGGNLRLTYNDNNGSATNYTDLTLASDGDLTIDSSGNGVTLADVLTFSHANYSTNYGLLYTNSGVLTQVGAGSTSQCLKGNTGSAPTWGTCGSSGASGTWTEGAGIHYPNNNTLDLLVGGTTTASAKFAILNVNGSGPATATVSGNLIVMPTNGAGGKLGIGNIDPTYLLDVNGTGQIKNILTENITLSTSSAHLVTARVGFNAYTNFSGGIGTGGIDSVLSAQRVTSIGNLTNIASIQGGQLNLTKGGTFATKVDYATGTSPEGITMGDVNGDGKNDLAVINNGTTTMSVLLNNGDGTFATKVDYTAVGNARNITMGDVNGDGKNDIIVTNWSGAATVSVFMNNGNGTFAAKVDYATGTDPHSLVVGDFDGNGKVDIATTNSGANTISILMNNGNGTFAAKTDYAANTYPEGIAMGDLNGDGKNDIAVGHANSNFVSVFINNGNGTFAAKADYAGASQPANVAIGDVDGDGKPDLVVPNHGATSFSIFLNKGNGTFFAKVDYTTLSSPLDVALGDLTGDGMIDVAIGNNAGTSISVFSNNGNGTFASTTDYTTDGSTRNIVMGDMNNDGKPDIATAIGGGTNELSVFLNQAQTILFAKASNGNVGIGTNSPTSMLHVTRPLSHGATGKALAIFDQIENQDIFTASASGTTRFVINNSGNVGIGNSNPLTALHITGNGPSIYIANSGESISTQLFLAPGDDNYLTGAKTGDSGFALGASTGGFVIGKGNVGVQFKMADNGNIGIGTRTSPTGVNPTAKLHVFGNSLHQPTASISGNTSAPTLLVTSDHATADLIVASRSGLMEFSVAYDGQIYAKGLTGTGGDFAEYFAKADKNEQFAAGQLVCLASTGVTRCTSNNPSQKLIGVVSDNALIIGGKGHKDDPNYVLVGMLGQLGIEATGTISAGDPLTYSSIPGVATVATGETNIIGYAKEGNEDGKRRVSSIIQPTYFNPNTALQTESGIDALSLVLNNGIFSLTKPGGVDVFKFEAFSKAVIANLRAGAINAQTIAVNSLNATTAFIGNLSGSTLSFGQGTFASLQAGVSNLGQATASTLAVATDTVTIGGQNIRDFIIETVRNAGFTQQPTSPLATADEVKTGVVSPLAENSTVQLNLNKNNIEVKNKTNGQTTAWFDDNGNASISGDLVARNIAAIDATFSGTLATNTVNSQNSNTQNLVARDATVAGTLRADTIVANNITGLEDKISSIAGNLIASNYTGNVNVETVTAQFGIFEQGITAMGPITAPILTATDQLAVGGNFTISNNAINTIGADLEIQSFRQGKISFQGGLIKMDTDGNMEIAGNLNVFGEIDAVFGVFSGSLSTKALATSIISPLPGDDLIIKLPTDNASNSAKLKVTNSQNQEVLSINNRGDIISSGAATLSKLNFNLVGQAQATSLSEAVATGSAGFATLRSGQPEITIKNPNITSKSLIYITPFGDTNNKVLYLLRQTPQTDEEEGSFTIGLSGGTSTTNIQFNWLIVN